MNFPTLASHNQEEAKSILSDDALPANALQRRVFLDVTLLNDYHGKVHTPRESLSQLLHSPLGVYIASISVAGEDLIVRFDIAASDVDFTLHMLISALPDAMIGRLLSRSV
ncbi:hypothetical protein [Robbsia andropogonis]|nr:hypothetical protein [Robbsia andropogonis]